MLIDASVLFKELKHFSDVVFYCKMKALNISLELLFQLAVYSIAGNQNFDLVKVQVKAGRRHVAASVDWKGKASTYIH